MGERTDVMVTMANHTPGRMTRLAFFTTFTATFGVFVWACSDSATSSSSSGGSSSGSSSSGSTSSSGGVDGSVKTDGSTSTCASPKTVCGTDCIDTTKDDDNCGGCGKKCAAGEMCAAGKCVVDCPSGSAKCTVGGKDACVNTQTDNANCGACGKKCDAGYVCSAGKCEITCTAGYSVCSGAAPAPTDAGVSDAASDAKADGAAATDAGATAPYCAKLTDDPLNCGKCGTQCNLDQSCMSGLCCNQGQTACGGKCTVTTEDPQNCGKCGNVCPNNTPYCSSGVCVDRYVFNGVKNDIPEATATTGWTQCFKEQYDQSTSYASIQASCSKAQVMVACRQVGAPNFQVLAQAPRADVFFDTGDADAATHDANGVSWYWSGKSTGFAPQGAGVLRQSCDWIDSYGGSPQQGAGKGDQRLCRHGSGSGTSWGWRCGRDNSIGNGWEVVYFHAN